LKESSPLLYMNMEWIGKGTRGKTPRDNT